MKTTILTDTQTALLTHALIEHVIAECTAVDTEARFDDLVDEIHRDSLTGPFAHLSPSKVMREMCPTDYRCGVSDMTGTDDTLREIRGEYYDEREVEAARESFVSEMQNELADLEAIGGEEQAMEIAQLEAKIAFAGGYSF
jgi:hypothetical protein